MTQPLTPTAQFTALIPGIQELAQFIVEEIHAFQPDLLIGLAHLCAPTTRPRRTPTSPASVSAAEPRPTAG